LIFHVSIALNSIAGPPALPLFRRPCVERKYMSSDKARRKKPELATLICEVGGGTGKNTQSQQASALKCKP